MSLSLNKCSITIEYLQQQCQIDCAGDWTVKKIHTIEQKLKQLLKHDATSIIINGEKIKKIDSAGALLIVEFIVASKKRSKKVLLEAFSKQALLLLDLAEEKRCSLHQKPRYITSALELVGMQTIAKLIQIHDFFNFFGIFCAELFWSILKPLTISFRSIVATMVTAGCGAVPIVILLNFLVGIVLAFEIGPQLQSYGATTFIVELTGFIVFREFAPLITAIIAAGRTSTAFAAQLGTMKMNEEMDAMIVMGVSPMRLLILPKVVGVVITLPLLTVLADFSGVTGALLMAQSHLGIHYTAFIDRFQHMVKVKHLFVGLVKVPVFGLLVALVGCFQGLQVLHSADEVGKKTTKAAVQAIFLILVTDAIFAVFFGLRGI